MPALSDGFRWTSEDVTGAEQACTLFGFWDRQAGPDCGSIGMFPRNTLFWSGMFMASNMLVTPACHADSLKKSDLPPAVTGVL